MKKNVHHIFLVALFICLIGPALSWAGWSMPQEAIYPASPPNESGSTAIATDANGNCVAIWYDASQIPVRLIGAILPSGAVNSQGQPAWTSFTTIASGVIDPVSESGYQVSPLGMDAQGNALVAWTDGNNNILVSRLAAGQTTWSSPITINTQLVNETVAAPSVAVASNGNAVVTWTSKIPMFSYTYHVLANVYDAQSSAWRGQQELMGGAVEIGSEYNSVVMNNQGNAYIGISEQNTGVQTLAYNFSTNTWTTITPIPTSDDAYVGIAIDGQGNETVVWVDQGLLTMNAATLPFGQTTYTNVTVLSSSVSSFNLPFVQTDSSGNALAVWVDADNNLASARFSFATQTWSQLPTVTQSNQIVNLTSLYMDAFGNALVGWVAQNTLSSYAVVVGLLLDNSTVWTQITTLSTFDQNSDVNVVITTAGNGVAIWEDDVDVFVSGIIYSSVYIGMIPVFPPVNFKGKVNYNEFLTQTDWFNILTWNPSQSTYVLQYNLYRNSELIATFPAGSSYYKYEDHNRHENVTYVYTLTAVGTNGIASLPVTVTITIK